MAHLTKKERARKERFKKIFYVIILLFLALLMTISLIPGGMGRSFGPQKRTRIVTLNGRSLYYSPSSPFYYVLRDMRKRAAKLYKSEILDLIQTEIVNESARSFINDYLMRNFAEKIGLRPSRFYIDRIALQRTGNPNFIIPPGMKKYITMQYDNEALSFMSGDPSTILSTVSLAELFSFYDIQNIKAKGEICYLNISNFVYQHISEKNLAGFYDAHRGKYADTVRVESLSVRSKKTSGRIYDYAKEKGWNAAVKKYLAITNKNLFYTPEITLSNKAKTMNRFKVAVTLSNKISRPVLEARAYHVMKVKSFPEYRELGAEAKRRIRVDYMKQNYAALRSTMDSEIQRRAKLADSLARADTPLKTAAAKSGLTYIKTKTFTPVSVRIMDNKDKAVDFPILKKEEWSDFFFTAKPGSLSKTYYSDAYIVLFKLSSRSIKPSDYSKITTDKKIYNKYLRFKYAASSLDFDKFIKKGVHYALDETGLRTLIH